MTSIRAFSEILMERDGIDRDTQARHAQIIHDEALRLTRLLDSLLDLNVLEQGQVTLNRETAPLRQLIDRALLATLALGPPGGLRIDRDVVREEIEVCTDLDRLAQVFINLVANARKYCDAPRPSLAIRVERRGDRLVVDFVDNGSGIPEPSQSLIFEKFARLTDGGGTGGAGLGLAICREIMTKLGGTIGYLPGQGGAGFRVELPVAAHARPA